MSKSTTFEKNPNFILCAVRTVQDKVGVRADYESPCKFRVHQIGHKSIHNVLKPIIENKNIL